MKHVWNSMLLMLGCAAVLSAGTISEQAGATMEKILIVYASKTGSTADVAGVIAAALRSEGYAVDLAAAKNAPSPESYTAVIIGSGIYMGKWMGDARTYLRVHSVPLQGKKVAFFQVCMTIKDDTEKNRAAVDAYAAEARALVQPVAVASFAGRVDPSRLGFFDRLAVTMVKAPIGDFRDHEKITAWVRQVSSLLRTGQSQ